MGFPAAALARFQGSWERFGLQPKCGLLRRYAIRIVAAVVLSNGNASQAQLVNKWVCEFTTAATYGGAEGTNRDPSRFKVVR
jgi:hypothetical protein